MKVNFIVTLSGVSERLEQFLKSFEKYVLVPREQASLTITLYNGSDSERVHFLINKYANLYPQSELRIIDIIGRSFARSSGLHRGVEGFKDDDLLFFTDVDIEIGSEFLQRARFNAIKGKQVYFPIVFKLYKLDFVKQYRKSISTELISRQNGHWAHYAFGIAVIYAGDYRKVGGLNTNMKGWGGEDVEFYERILSYGLEVFRTPDPSLIHAWHPKVCNSNTVSSTTYRSCLNSKAENLADRNFFAPQ